MKTVRESERPGFDTGSGLLAPTAVGPALARLEPVPAVDDGSVAPETTEPSPPGSAAVVAVPLEPESERSGQPLALERVLGRSPVQRHLYHLASLGVARCDVLFPPRPGSAAARAECLRQLAELPLDGMEVRLATVQEWPGPPPEVENGLLWVSGGAVFDPRLYRYVAAAVGPVVLVDRGEAEGAEAVLIGLARLEPADVAECLADFAFRGFPDESTFRGRRVPVDAFPTYLPDLRRHLRPYWCRLRAESDLERAERRILDSAQKGVLDFPARFLHPIPENLLTRGLSRTAVRPNHVTGLTALLGFAAAYLFATGAFAAGLALAFAVNVLDGVDGKLARVRLETSRLGDRLDHLLDVAFEFSWYAGLGWGLSGLTGHGLPLRLGLGIIGVMAASRAVSGVYKSITGHQIHDHRSFDRAFRLVAGRRNVFTFLLLGGLLADRMSEAFQLVFGWAVATLVVYAARTLIAHAPRLAPQERSPLFPGRPGGSN